MKFQAIIEVMLKADVADVQGMAIEQSLRHHGQAVEQVRAGKRFELVFEAASAAEAEESARKLATEVFSNPVIETARVKVAEAPARTGA